MCRPFNSSSLLKLYNNNKDLGAINCVEYRYLNNKDYIKEAHDTKILKNFIIDHLNEYDWSFIGGEPFLDQNIIDILCSLDITTDRLIKFNSNMSINITEKLDKILKYLNKCNSLITISVDCDPDRHSYIRNCNVKLLENNINYIRKTYPKIELRISAVIQALNIGYIKETYEYFVNILKFNENKIQWCFDNSNDNKNGVTSIYSLPQNLIAYYREKYLNNIQKINIDQKILYLIDNHYKYYDNECWERFCRYMKIFDKIQDKNIFDFYPEFKEYWVE
jgi:hypothetical protein